MESTGAAALAPVSASDRIASLDVLRGFALLGILAMNIQSFAMPGAAYFFPRVYGELDGANAAVWLLAEFFARRKFMTLFALLFGAGMMLMHERAEAGGRSATRVMLRRLFWLWVIGMLHAYLLWEGDVLVSYAVSGLVVLWFRRRSTRALVVWGFVFLTVGSALSVLAGVSAPYWPEASLADFRQQWQPDAATLAEEIAATRGSWPEAFGRRSLTVFMMHIFYLPFAVLWRAGGLMLLGMALVRSGWLQGWRSRRSYLLTAIAGIPVGLVATAVGLAHKDALGWEPAASFFLASQWGYWGSLFQALGYAALIILIVASPGWQIVTDRLSAVGRLALSNYLLQTVLVSSLMAGWGFGLFGQVSRLAQASLVLAVWLVQLGWSPVWLHHFRFGPAEWLWRRLTYGRRIVTANH